MNTSPTLRPMPTDASSDAELVSLSVAGNDLAFAQIMRRYNRLLFRTARSILKSDDDTQDALQEAYLRAWRALATFRSEARLSTWLHAIATSVAMNGLRKVKRFRTRETALEAADAVTVGRRTAEPDLKVRLHAAIDALPLKYRTVVVLHDVEGYTHEEIAATLNVEVGTSKAQLSRARAKLREALADFAGEWAS